MEITSVFETEVSCSSQDRSSKYEIISVRGKTTRGSAGHLEWIRLPNGPPISINNYMRYFDIVEEITSDEYSLYGDSDCATLAYYLAKTKGYKIGIINSKNNDFVHAFIVIDKTTGLDIYGRRPIKKILKDYKARTFNLIDRPADLEDIAFITHKEEKFVCNNLIPRLLKQLS